MSHPIPVRTLLLSLCLSLLVCAPVQAGDDPTAQSGAPENPTTLPYPILFVAQPPIRSDFTTIGSTFGNQGTDMSAVARGGDLWIRYPDGSLKNLTAAAGYGAPSAFQGATAIAVRDPAVHWSGSKALFSMVIGAPTQRYQWITVYWQLYEITGLGPADTPIITLVPNQPANFNNIYPLYASDERIIFVSDRPRDGAAHLYPQRDEYELAPTNTGLWSLDPQTGDLRLLNHAPSGDFGPIIDSFGRVLFTQWDHLQRDQQADADANYGTGANCASSYYGTFNYSDESAAAVRLDDRSEVYPEPRPCRGDLLGGTNLAGHTFNQFFPWQINEDGSEGETINHLGRHELAGWIPRALTDDPNLIDYYGQIGRFNPNLINNMFQIKEDPLHPGAYYGVDAPEFSTHASGQVISMTVPPGLDADHVAVTYVTHRATASYRQDNDPPNPNHSGHYREPLPLADGTLLAVHTPETRAEGNQGGPHDTRYDFRLKTLTLGANGYWVGGQLLTTGITKTLGYWSPDEYISYSGPLWELNPVEVRPRPIPSRPTPPLAAPEQQMFDQAGVTVAELRAYLVQNQLALAVSRNVTTRDDLDKQQPFNLRVPGGAQTLGTGGRIYDLGHLQFFQADQLRGFSGCCGETPFPGRRVLAQPLHDAAALNNNPLTGGPTGSVAVALDGSTAAFVPARRAMTWQLTDGSGASVIRERYWITFQPGEVRVCTSCHGLNTTDQAGQLPPANPPQALLQLLQYWKAQHNATATPTPLSATPTATPTPAVVTVTPTSTGVPASATPTSSPTAAPVTPPPTPNLPPDHPRLWLRPADLPRLRAWAVPSNPIYAQGIQALALDYKARMDDGRLFTEDCGCTFGAYYAYPVEWGAELFAFMSLIENSPATRADYAQRARTLLMTIMDQAVLGPTPEDSHYRGANFSTNMRSLFFGEAFPLTVDWIYPSLTAQDKLTIRTVFLRWLNENLVATTSGLDHPEPVWLLNNPALLADADRFRTAANNFFDAHMNQIGLMAMSLDAADDPGNPNVVGDQVQDYLADATGAWLYMHRQLTLSQAGGGISPEGAAYGPTGLGRAAELMLALYTAGQADPAVWGPQVQLDGDPFWDAVIPGHMQLLSPVPSILPGLEYMGPVHLPTDFGDAQDVWMRDTMTLFGALGLYADYRGDNARRDAIRWAQTHLAPGGAARLVQRAGDFNHVRDCVLYFMLFDPAAAPVADPRPALPTEYLAPGAGLLSARTGWDAQARWFTYKLGWNSIDHQQGTGNMFEFYRKGEWLTKQWAGYGVFSGNSDYKNTLALQNDPPNTGISFWQANYAHGSQYAYGPGGDPTWLAHSLAPHYVYASGDAANLYNNPDANSSAILQAQRAIVWLKPDTIVVYDRAASASANRFKRFWLMLPAAPIIVGHHVTVTTAGAQTLAVDTLLPTTATLSFDNSVPNGAGYDETAVGEMMHYRLQVEAPGGPAAVRFLHVLQGLDAGAAPAPVTAVQSASGIPYAGAIISDTAVLFPVNFGDSGAFSVSLPATVTAFLITGLLPNAGVTLTVQPAGAGQTLSVTPGGQTYRADGGGVLALGRLASPACVDQNQDGRSGADDVQQVAGRWNTHLLTPGWDASLDLNYDGQIDLLDVTLAASAWDQACTVNQIW